MTFRALSKEPIPGQAPIDIVEEIRVRAAKARRSHSSIVSEILCLGLGKDPTAYGITAKQPKPLAHVVAD